MVYVLKSSAFDENENQIKLIKIGYTDNWEKRYAQYKLHNPTVKVLCLYEDGNEEDEKSLHSYFSEYKYKDYGNEWFYYNEKIVNFFPINDTIDKIRAIIPKIFKIKKSDKRLLILYINSAIEILYTPEEIVQNKNLRNSLESIILSSQTDVNLSELDKWFKLNYSSKYEEIKKKYESLDKEISEFQNRFESLKTFEDRMRLLCEADLSEPARNSILDLLSEYYKVFYVTLGPERCKSLGYNYTKMKLDINVVTFDTNIIKNRVQKDFKEGTSIEYTKLKSYFEQLYKEFEYNKTPKAVDICNYFETKKVKINSGESRVNGFKLIKKKG